MTVFTNFIVIRHNRFGRLFCLRYFAPNRLQVHLRCSAVAVRVNQYHWRTAWPYTIHITPKVMIVHDDDLYTSVLFRCSFFSFPLAISKYAFDVSLMPFDAMTRRLSDTWTLQFQLQITTNCPILIEMKENVYTFHTEFMFCCCHWHNNYTNHERSNKSMISR